MYYWQQLEEYLDSWLTADQTGEFTSQHYATDEDISPADASLIIQCYLSAQRAKRPRTKYLLHRKPGTRACATVWQVGARTKDADYIAQAFDSDTECRLRRAVEPDLNRLAAINPRAARKVQRQLDAIINGAMLVLRAAVQGIMPDDE